MEKNNEELINAILEKTFKDGDIRKLRCAAALKIADQFGVKPMEVGKICNEKKIRISNCQLGCFE
ncbi:MAG TPA: hypothetical protein VMZ04_06550 [Anaerolineae bacterium]|nr:hypothetical protein [Anaerolineae bacterium]